MEKVRARSPSHRQRHREHPGSNPNRRLKNPNDYRLRRTRLLSETAAGGRNSGLSLSYFSALPDSGNLVRVFEGVYLQYVTWSEDIRFWPCGSATKSNGERNNALLVPLIYMWRPKHQRSSDAWIGQMTSNIAMCERFFAILRWEPSDRRKFRPKAADRMAVLQFIENRHNAAVATGRPANCHPLAVNGSRQTAGTCVS